MIFYLSTSATGSFFAYIQDMPSTTSSPTTHKAFYGIYALAILVFLPAVSFGFLYDDMWTILENNFLRSLANGFSVLNEETMSSVPDKNRPTMVLSMLFDYTLWQNSSKGYHIHSIILHGLTSGLLYLTLTSYGASQRASMLSALLFVLHPFHIEPVTIINYREDVLVALGGVTALFFLTQKKNLPSALGAALALALAVGAKETAWSFLPLLFLIPLFGASISWKRACSIAVPSAALVLWLWLTYSQGSPSIGTYNQPLSARLADGFASFCLQMFQFIVPIGFSGEYPKLRDDITFLSLIGLALFTALLVVGYKTRKSHPRLAFLSAALALTSMPHLGFIPLVNIRADRFFYVPSLAACSLTGLAITKLSASLTEKRFWVLSGCVGVCLALLLYINLPKWSSPTAFWGNATQTAPQSARAWKGYAFALVTSGKSKEALAAANKGLAISPTNSDVLATKGMALSELGRHTEAIATLKKAEQLAAGARKHRAANNLGVGLEKNGDLKEALRWHQTAVQLAPHLRKYKKAVRRVTRKLSEQGEALPRS